MCADSTRSDSTPSRPFDATGAKYDPDSGTYHARFDADADAVVVVIADTVATITDREVTDMPPLFATVDPEALTELVTSSRERSVEVSFAYEGCEVTVTSDGEVVVEPPEN